MFRKGFFYVYMLAAVSLLSSCSKGDAGDALQPSQVTISLDMTNCADDEVVGMSVLVFGGDSLLKENINVPEYTTDSKVNLTLNEGAYTVMTCTNTGTDVDLVIPEETAEMKDVYLMPKVETAFARHPHLGMTFINVYGGKAENVMVQANRLLADFKITVTGLDKNVKKVRATLLNSVTGINVGTLQFTTDTYTTDCGTVDATPVYAEMPEQQETSDEEESPEVLSCKAEFASQVCMPTLGVAKFKLELMDAEGNVLTPYGISVVAFKNGGIYNVEADFSTSTPYITVNGIDVDEWEDGDVINGGANQLN